MRPVRRKSPTKHFAWGHEPTSSWSLLILSGPCKKPLSRPTALLTARILGGLSKLHHRPVLRKESLKINCLSRFSWVVIVAGSFRISLAMVGRFPNILSSETCAANSALSSIELMSCWTDSLERPSLQPPKTKSKQGSSKGPAARYDGDPTGEAWAEGGSLENFWSWTISACKSSIRWVWLRRISSSSCWWFPARVSNLVIREAWAVSATSFHTRIEQTTTKSVRDKVYKLRI